MVASPLIVSSDPTPEFTATNPVPDGSPATVEFTVHAPDELDTVAPVPATSDVTGKLSDDADVIRPYVSTVTTGYVVDEPYVPADTPDVARAAFIVHAPELFDTVTLDPATRLVTGRLWLLAAVNLPSAPTVKLVNVVALP
jgi:hypothetical protein